MICESGITRGIAGRLLALCCFLLLAAAPLWPQNSPPAAFSLDEASALIGLKLDELAARFGLPQTVYASRGQETWQDDVVFVYGVGEFYIFKDRVWQVSLKTAGGIALGDPKAAVTLTLGETAEDNGAYVLFPLPPVGWPLTLRVNFNPAGSVSAIFIYRPDF
ncbi:MAG TPA: hypothetical protein DEQ14_01940 [Treponema sp.]|nr:hypothetical protein [Treponema sp.]